MCIFRRDLRVFWAFWALLLLQKSIKTEFETSENDAELASTYTTKPLSYTKSYELFAPQLLKSLMKLKIVNAERAKSAIETTFHF